MELKTKIVVKEMQYTKEEKEIYKQIWDLTNKLGRPDQFGCSSIFCDECPFALHYTKELPCLVNKLRVTAKSFLEVVESAGEIDEP